MKFQYLSILLVTVGALLLTGGLCYVRKIVHERTPGRRSWSALSYLIGFFIVGYLVFGAGLWGQPTSTIELVVALIFFGGGWFVLLVARLSARTIFDVKKLSLLEQENAHIRAMQQRLQSILDTAAEGIFIFNEDGVLEAFNHAAEKLFGYREDEVIGRDVSMLLPEDRRGRGRDEFSPADVERVAGRERELLGRRKDGSRFPMALKISATASDGRRLFTGLASDISERKAMVDHLKYMAEHDTLTGLHNRSYFEVALERAIMRARDKGSDFAVLYIDLDNFKQVNDSVGHAAGDRLLVEVARLLKRRARERDVVARLGGDEFVVLLHDTEPQGAVQIAESFRERVVTHRFDYAGRNFPIQCSIGIAPLAARETTVAGALEQADIACYLAKRAGRNRIHLFSPGDEAAGKIVAS